MINVFPCVREFYILEALFALKKVNPYKFGHEKWDYDFEHYRENYNSMLATAIYDYTVLVVSGEMRHGSKMSEFYHPNFGSMLGRSGAYATALQYNPVELLEIAHYMFDTHRWHAGYGGKSWAKIAEAGLNRNRWTDTIFIDHCVDLSHNNSIYFDKCESQIFFMSHKDTYRQFLTWKSRVNPQELIKYGGASNYSMTLIQRGANLGILPRDAVPFREVFEDTNIARKWVLEYVPVKWQNKRIPMILRTGSNSEYSRYLGRLRTNKWVDISEDIYEEIIRNYILEDILEEKRRKEEEKKAKAASKKKKAAKAKKAGRGCSAVDIVEGKKEKGKKEQEQSKEWQECAAGN